MGVLVGVLSTMAVGMVVSVAGAGFLLLGSVKNSSAQVEGKQQSAVGTTETGMENLLNADFLSQVSMIDSYLDKYYLHDVDAQKVRDGMLAGLMMGLNDPYSGYYNAGQLASFQDSTEGEYVGIGAAVTQERSTGIVRISKPYEGTPSAEAGLLPGDILVSVDETEVTGMDLNQVVSLIKGEEGTKVTLKIYREKKKLIPT